MFFAAIATGIDLTGGWCSFAAAEKHNVGVLYKDVSIQFKRRVDGDLTLISRNNKAITEACEEAAKTGLRINVPVEIEGYCYDTFGDVKPVVTAQATLSMKVILKQVDWLVTCGGSEIKCFNIVTFATIMQ